MSVNILNNDKTLAKISSNNNINKHDRGSYIGRRDTLWIGNTSGNLELALTHPITDYDYIDIEFGSSKWLALNMTRYRCNAILNSTSNNALRFYVSSSFYFTFYIRYNNPNYIYFSNGTMSIRRIIGVKLKNVSTNITCNGSLEEYNDYQTITNQVYKYDAVFRKVIDYIPTTDLTSSFGVYHYLKSNNIISCECSVVSPLGETRILPSFDENGNEISFYCKYDYIYIVVKGMKIEKNSIVRIILDYSL